MDWRNRCYYCVSFDVSTFDMRRVYLKLIDDSIKFTPYKDIQLQPDELEPRGFYQFMIGAPLDCKEVIEYELKKAERNDDYCHWKEIKETECK